MPVNENKSSPKSNRRRRWEVKSKESFETSLAVEVDSPQNSYYNNENSEYNNNNKSKRKGRPQTAHSILSKKNNFTCKNNDDHSSHDEEETDVVSAKLSALLDTAKGSPKNNMYQPHLRDSEENLINSELKNYFGPSSSMVDPSAPPFSPEIVKKVEKSIKAPNKKVSMKVSPAHSEVNIINSKITEQLKHLSEDIKDDKRINLSNESVIPTVTVSGLLLGPSSSSTFNGNVSTIYCERLNNFVISENYYSQYQNKPSSVIKERKSRKSFAVSIQTGFRTFSVLCQGLVAGLTVAHCFMIFLLQEAQNILLEKKAIEHVFFSLIFFLSVLCLVSAFDRCDVAGQGVFSEHGIRIPWTPLFYFISFTLTLIAIKVEDIVTHFDTYPPEIQSNKGNLMYWWKFVCLSRTIFAMLAWIAIIKDPHTDALNSRISEFSED